MKRVNLIRFNWIQVGSTLDRDGCGEDYSTHKVGDKGVLSIEENEPHNGMQLWNYVVNFEDGTSCRIFNPNYVEYFKD